MQSISIQLPASKSISNRVLILRAIAGSNAPILNLSEARDTQDLLAALESRQAELYAGEGATTLRFLLAYLALKGEVRTIRCATQLQGRPIKPLLQVLEQMGCEFQFLEDAYRLPLRMLRGISEDYPRIIELDARQSSQFVSAMMLIAPALRDGLEIRTGADRVSDPYIRQTLLLMRMMGETVEDDGHSIRVESGYHFPMVGYAVESDWSAAAFFYARLALRESGRLFFPGLRRSGLQGDQKVAEFFTAFGVSTMETDDGIQIEKTKCEWPVDVQFDFTAFPDLFPPIAMFCAIRKINARFHGLQHLEHKESNRLKVISDFFLEQSVQMEFTKQPDGTLSGVFHMKHFNTAIKDHYPAHGDHRIAMAFSLLNVLRPIRIDDPNVVGKSFPGFWEELRKGE